MNAVIDRLVQYPNRFQLTNISDGTVLGTFDLSPVTGTVSVVGTILNHDLFQSIADDLASRVKTEGGVVSNTTETFTMAGTRTNISSGETISVSFGKIAKIINDLKAVAFSGDKADIGLGNVDNTSDASKPVSNATEIELNKKVDKVAGSSLMTDAEHNKLSAYPTYQSVSETYLSKADASSTYLPLSGGTLTGDLNVGNTTIFASGSNGGLNSILVGDDAFLGDCNVGGHIGVKARTSDYAAGFQFYTNNSQNLGRITFSLSGAEINTTYSGDQRPVLTCTGNTDSLLSYGVASFYPNLSAGNNVYCPIGVKYAKNDCIGMGFHYTADGSTSNYSFIRAWATEDIARFFADMHSEFAGDVYAKKFIGDLSGTAEKAVCDTNGANITSTYLSKADASSTYATKSALDSKQDTLTFDSVPTENSTNPVTSGGAYTAIAKKLDKGDWMEFQFDYVKNTDTVMPISPALENGTYICEILARGTGDYSRFSTCYSLGVFSLYDICSAYVSTGVNKGDNIIHYLSASIDKNDVTVRGDLVVLQGNTYTSVIRFRKIADD